jgi:hypothetical protein
MNDGRNTETMRHGVKVFGSAVLRVAPDAATIVFAVSRAETKPEAAFAAARRDAREVNTYLQRRGLRDVGSSRVSISQQFQFVGGERRSAGYAATIGFNLVLKDLDQVEETIIGLVAAGANVLTSVTFQTSRLRAIRAEARKDALAAAREKAELYCAAAGMAAGRLLGIEDANPLLVTGRSEGHVTSPPIADEESEPKAIDPASIAVSAAVNVLYELTNAP